MVPKSESLCKEKMNCLGYVLTFRSLLRVFDEGKEEDVERGLCKEPTTLASRDSMTRLGNGSKIRESMQKENELFRLCFNLQISFKGF